MSEQAANLIEKLSKQLVSPRERKKLFKKPKVFTAKAWTKKRKAKKVQKLSRKRNRG